MDVPDLLADRYRLGPILGRGGMGVVHRAHDDRLGRDVAVKLLDVEHAPAAAVQRFRREAQFLAGLSHPNVVTVFDFGTDDTSAWLVMELLAGPTLQALVEQHGPLPIADVVRYGQQAASALAAAHAAGITHRDVKPANLMLAADGTCKLLDLGIARLDGAATTQPALTQAGTILGTVPYLAPEVITGEAPQPAADLYALGGVLFALLTAHPPFQGEDLMAAMAQHVHAPVPRPSAVRGDVPADLDELVFALLAKDPAARPTAADVVARLNGSPTAAVAPTIALGASVPPAAATTAAATTTAIGRSPHRSRTALVAAGVVLALALLVAVLLLANSGSDTPVAGSGGGSSTATHGTSPHPTSRPRGSTSSATSTPAQRPTPAPTDLASALTALRSAVAAAQASGGLSAADAQDLAHRVDQLAQAAAAPPPGGPGKGNGKGNDNGQGHGPGKKAPDLSGPIQDFQHHLDDLRSHGSLSAASYSAIRSALAAVSSFAPSGDGGD